MTVAERKRIWRIAGMEVEESIYGHPNGWRIKRCARDYTLRGFPRGAIGATQSTSPKVWWEISPALTHPKRVVYTARTLRDARAWCDEHKRGQA